MIILSLIRQNGFSFTDSSEILIALLEHVFLIKKYCFLPFVFISNKNNQPIFSVGYPSINPTNKGQYKSPIYY